MKTQSCLRIAIYVAVEPSAGGAYQSTVGLIQALGELDGPERYTLIVKNADAADRLKPHCGPNQSIVVRSQLSGGRRLSFAGVLKLAMGPLLPTARRLQQLLALPSNWPEVPVSDGFFEGLGCDVLHFPTQWFAVAALPTIYNPHDIQHLHYPQFFTPEELVQRETLYRTACHFAQTVVVGTQWVKNDIVRRYGMDPDRIQVIPWASPTQFYAEPEAGHVPAVAKKYELTRPFAFYPAVTWPHKNHVRLLEAIALLRDQKGITVRLVCTGRRHEPFWPRIAQCVSDLNLADQVKFLGHVSEVDLRALYRLAQFLIFPSLYEADSCPIHEAWSEGTAVASSNATALADQVDDAGLLFDPMDVSAIADAMAQLATDPAARDTLRQRGYRRVADFDWARTARAYRAVYRRAADLTLTDEDRWLLQWDWMREPRRPETPSPLRDALT